MTFFHWWNNFKFIFENFFKMFKIYLGRHYVLQLNLWHQFIILDSIEEKIRILKNVVGLSENFESLIQMEASAVCLHFPLSTPT